MDSDVEFAICMHCRDGLVHRFIEVGDSLYAHDLDNANHQVITTPCLAQTVAELEAQFTKHEAKLAHKARDLHRHLGYLAQRAFEALLTKGFYCNSPITVDDAHHGLRSYGPLPELLCGKAKRTTPSTVLNTKVELLPPYILQEHKIVTLVINFISVNGNFPPISSPTDYNIVPSKAV